MIKYEFHPLAAALPVMHEPEFSEFVEDIRKNGQILPIGVYEGKILDGRNRYLACRKLGIEGKFERVSPKDAKKYVTSINVHRRQLTREQKQHHLMMLIAQQDTLDLTNAEVAKAADVSKRTVQRKKRASRKGVSKEGGLTPPSSDNGETNETETEAKVEVDTDADGKVVPPAALPFWRRKSEAKNVLNQISAARGQIKKLASDDPMYAQINLNGVMSDLNSAYNRFAAAVPAHVCPYCKGHKPDDCKGCKGKGVVSEYFWKLAPEELRNARD